MEKSHITPAAIVGICGTLLNRDSTMHTLDRKKAVGRQFSHGSGFCDDNCTEYPNNCENRNRHEQQEKSAYNPQENRFSLRGNHIKHLIRSCPAPFANRNRRIKREYNFKA